MKTERSLNPALDFRRKRCDGPVGSLENHIAALQVRTRRKASADPHSSCSASIFYFMASAYIDAAQQTDDDGHQAPIVSRVFAA